MAKRIEIFRVGKHIANDGKSYSFSEAMLRDACAAYDPATFTARMVVGHPKIDDPSYGDVTSLHYRDDGVVEMEYGDVEPQFAELVNAKRFNSISPTWYLPTSPDNPKPGHLYPRHIGFLGAHPPAIKGLKSASFNEAEEGVVSFGEWADVQHAALWRRFRDWLIGEKGIEEADRIIPDYQIQSLEAAAREPSVSSSINPSYSEQHMERPIMSLTAEQIAQKEQELAAREAALNTQEAAFAERQSAQNKAARHVEHVSFCESLVKEGKLLPAQQDRMVAFMDSLDAATTVSFGEAEAVPQLTLLKQHLQSGPKLVEFGEHAAAAEPSTEGIASFAAPAGYSVDPVTLELHAKALAYQKANPEVAYPDAVNAVSA